MNDRYTGIGNLEIMEEAVRYNRFLARLAAGHAPPGGGTILDFGAGSGTLACQLRQMGHSVTCLEVDSALRSRLRDEGLNVIEAVADLDDGTVDYIYSFNVLEHIEDDRAALAGLYRVLAARGLLLLYVPAFPLLFSSMDRQVGHWRRYRRRPLLELLEQTGFEVVRCEYVDCLGFLAALLYRWVGSRQGDIDRSSLRLFDRWIFPISRFLDKATRGLFGKNLLAVAVKH